MMLKTLIGAAALFAAPAAFAQDVPQGTTPADPTASTPAPAPDPTPDPSVSATPAPDAAATPAADPAPQADAPQDSDSKDRKKSKKSDPRN